MRKGEQGLLVLAALTICLATGTLSRGQATPPQAERIYFSALDKSEKPVLGLEAKNFELRIDGKTVPMEGFRAGLPHTDRSIPLVAWIMLDFNPNISDKVIRNQADSAGGALGMLNSESALGVKLVSDRSETLAPLGHNAAALRGALIQYQQRRSEIRVGIKTDSVTVGEAAIAGALEYAVDEIDVYIKSQPTLSGREVHRAVMIISDGNLNPNYKLKSLYAKAARQGVSLYPVFLPTHWIGSLVDYYFALAQKTAGVASYFGAIAPGKDYFSPPSNNQGPNALTFNFINMIRDINGKYSFEVPPSPQGKDVRIKLNCRAKGVKIRLARTILP